MLHIPRIKCTVAHAQNNGHGNLGDDAMADNIYNKLRYRFTDLHTISSYYPPKRALINNNITSLSRICFDYDSVLKRYFLLICHKFRMSYIRQIYVIFVCSEFYACAVIYKHIRIAPSISRKKRQLIMLLADIDIYIRSGAGSINDIWYESSVIPMYYEARVCKLFHAKVVFSGQGIGPVSPNRLKFIRRLLREVDIMTFRDSGVSEKLLRENNIYGRKYKSIGDDAFDLPYNKIDVNNMFSERYRPVKHVICIQFRLTDYQNTYNTSFWSKIGQMMTEINTNVDGVFFVFLPMSYGRVSDEQAGVLIQSQYNRSNYKILNEKLSASEVKGVISSSRLAIGQSYHFGVFALSSNVPFICVYTNDYYKLKSQGLLGWYDREHWGLSLKSIGGVAPMAGQILRDWDKHVTCLQETNSQLQKNINEFYNIILPHAAQCDSIRASH